MGERAPRLFAELPESLTFRDGIFCFAAVGGKPCAVTARDLIGRDDELDQISAFLRGVESLPSALVLGGEPGIGKTTLWRRGIADASAHGYQVLACSPAEMEAELAYAAVADLIEEALPEIEQRLPPPQRWALRIALFLEEAKEVHPDRRAVAAALLGALRALASRSRLLIAIDDVQWLDASSAAALAFAARRIRDTPIAFLMSSRGAENPLDVPEDRLWRVDVGPLSLGALRRLLEERIGRIYPRPLLRRLHEVSGGNPFYALELGRVTPEHELSRREPLPVPDRLADLIGARLRLLPQQTIAVLGAAAALADPTLELVEAAIGSEAVTRLSPAVDAGLVEVIGGQVRFTHPLFAESVQAGLEPGAARALHARLAAIVPELEQRARHLAASADPPDEAVARALEEAARAAASRGAPASAAELAEAAVTYTPPRRPEDLRRRTLAAADHHDVAGGAVRARVLLGEVVARERAGHDRAVALERLARIAADADTAIRLFEQASDEAADDLALKVTVEQGLAGAKWVARSAMPDAVRHLREALRLAEQLRDDRTLLRVLGALVWVEVFLGTSDASARLDRALRLRERARGLALVDDPRWTKANVLAWTDGLERARTVLDTLCREAVARDEEGALAMFLHMLGKVEWRLGHWADARRHVDQAEELARYLELDTVRAFALEKQVLLYAYAGDVDAARSKAAETLAAASWTETSVRHSLGVLALSRGDPAEACRELEPVCESAWRAGVREPTHLREMPEAVQAFVAVGETARAAELLERFEQEARRLERRSGLALAGRCRGLLAATEGRYAYAEAAFEEALGQHRRVQEPFELARTFLAFGSVQRRAKRRSHARELLGHALAIFEELGARLWAERARAELARIGGRAPSSGDLTATERQLADLVAQGLSNKEIAAALFVTPKTVGTKLSRIYAKVGVHSRTELVRRLGERTSKV
jgi:DNA-binding CsgD family transcriptional regulator